jgi:CheY-like chemotaxis protein
VNASLSHGDAACPLHGRLDALGLEGLGDRRRCSQIDERLDEHVGSAPQVLDADVLVRVVARLRLAWEPHAEGDGVRHPLGVRATAAGAVARAAEHPDPIDLVLTDVVMPGMSGPELASRLAPLRPDAPVVYMSGYTADVIARRSLLPPGAWFLEKPFSEGDLLRKVREALSAAHR